MCLAHMSGREIDFIREAFADNWVVPLGPNVDGFEEDLRHYLSHSACGAATVADPHVAALSSGTAAVHLALAALGVGLGDEVMVQTFTFCASSHPVTYLGATPVFVDSEEDTWNMDPAVLDKAIADRIEKTGRKPKAIVIVHLYGMPAKLDELTEVARKWDIPLVEDAAEAFGSEYDCRRCGTFGTFGVLSFNGNKMITTSGGGALVCRDEDSRKRIMFLATQGREAFPYYQHEEIGYNYRMSNICAGIGRGQMTIVDEHVAHHHHAQALYEELFKDTEGITVHRNPSEKFNSNYWVSTITVDENIKVKGMDKAYAKATETAVGGIGAVTNTPGTTHTDNEPNTNIEALRLALNEADIESRPLWKPMHLQPVYAKNPAYINGVSESLFRCGLCLPAGPWVSDDDIRRIVDTIKGAIL